MEENYLVAAKRETLSDILSYIYEPEHILSGHLDAFNGKFLNCGLEQVLDSIGWHTVERHAIMMCCHLVIYDIQRNNWWQDTDTPQSYPQDSIYYKKKRKKNNNKFLVIVNIAVKWQFDGFFFFWWIKNMTKVEQNLMQCKLGVTVGCKVG